MQQKQCIPITCSLSSSFETIDLPPLTLLAPSSWTLSDAAIKLPRQKNYGLLVQNFPLAYILDVLPVYRAVPPQFSLVGDVKYHQHIQPYHTSLPLQFKLLEPCWLSSKYYQNCLNDNHFHLHFNATDVVREAVVYCFTSPVSNTIYGYKPQLKF